MPEKHEELQYLDLLQEIMQEGIEKENRTGVKTKYLFSKSMRFDISKTIPLFTTKKVYFKGIVEELLFFLRGDTDSTILEKKNVNIWKGNTTRQFLDSQGLNSLPEGNIGCSYSHQWRNFGGKHPFIKETENCQGFDQINYIVDKLKSDPLDRRLILDAWCANQLKYMALPPCHVIYVFNYNPRDNKLNCHMTQRSCDMFLGVPFNIASLAILTYIMAKTANMNPGEIHWTGVDVHLYDNQYEASIEQISREPFDFPSLKINREISTVDDIGKLQFEDFELIDYKYHKPIKVEMVV